MKVSNEAKRARLRIKIRSLEGQIEFLQSCLKETKVELEYLDAEGENPK